MRQAVLLLALLPLGQACLYNFGEATNSLEAHDPSTHFTWAFNGDDWGGTCGTGKKQSPISLYPSSDRYEPGPVNLRTTWSYTPLVSNGKNVYVYNNGHTIQVEWAKGALQSSVLLRTHNKAVTDMVTMDPNTPPQEIVTVNAVPQQFHFHIDSEHDLDGHGMPLEMHIVHTNYDLPGCTPETPCRIVTGIFLVLDEENKDNEAMQILWNHMPWREGGRVNVTAGQVLDIEGLLPKDRTYITYEGSLTTPPCSEGVLWMVMTTPVKISLPQMQLFQAAVSFKNCSDTEVLEPPPWLVELSVAHGDPGNFNSLSQASHSRKLQAHSHSHAHGHSHHGPSEMARVAKRAKAFVRGSRTGFVEMLPGTHKFDPQRRLLAATEEHAEHDNSSCVVGAYGWNTRNVQPVNGRPVRIYFTSPDAALAVYGDGHSTEPGDRKPEGTVTPVPVDTSGLATSDQVYGVGLGVGLGMGIICVALLLTILSKISALQPPTPAGTVYLEQVSKA